MFNDLTFWNCVAVHVRRILAITIDLTALPSQAIAKERSIHDFPKG